MYHLHIWANPLDPSLSLHHRHSIIRLLRRKCEWFVQKWQIKLIFSNWMKDDDSALVDVFSLLSDISSQVILLPWCIDFGELLIDLAFIQSVCLQYVNHLSSQDLKTASLAPDYRAASQQFLCPLKMCSYQNVYFLKVFLKPGHFLLRISAKLISLYFHFNKIISGTVQSFVDLVREGYSLPSTNS